MSPLRSQPSLVVDQSRSRRNPLDALDGLRVHRDLLGPGLPEFDGPAGLHVHRRPDRPRLKRTGQVFSGRLSLFLSRKPWRKGLGMDEDEEREMSSPRKVEVLARRGSEASKG